MNKYNSTSASGGLSLCGVLTVIFIVLKLLNLIDWSWWWVVSPTLISIGITILACIVAILVIIIDESKYKKKNKR